MVSGLDYFVMSPLAPYMFHPQWGLGKQKDVILGSPHPPSLKQHYKHTLYYAHVKTQKTLSMHIEIPQIKTITQQIMTA